jgi:phage terminase large subunit-like protein
MRRDPWCDEIAVWRYPQTWTETLVPALRIGNPRVVVTTTPRPIPLLREMIERDDGSVTVTRGATFDNEANLSSQALAELRRRYEGTRIGRQELAGELIDDVEGALWTRAMLEPHRVASVESGQLARIVVAVDPAVRSGEGSDDTGIVVDRGGRQCEGAQHLHGPREHRNHVRPLRGAISGQRGRIGWPARLLPGARRHGGSGRPAGLIDYRSVVTDDAI